MPGPLYHPRALHHLEDFRERKLSEPWAVEKEDVRYFDPARCCFCVGLASSIYLAKARYFYMNEECLPVWRADPGYGRKGQAG